MSASEIKPIDILLVEDSSSDATLTITALEEGRLGNRISTVADGVEAMRFLRREGPYGFAPRPGLILLDLNLPRKDGRQVLDEIRSAEKLWGIPVVVLTGSSAETDLLIARHFNANGYLIKPVDVGRLIEALRRIPCLGLCVATRPKAPAG